MMNHPSYTSTGHSVCVFHSVCVCVTVCVCYSVCVSCALQFAMVEVAVTCIMDGFGPQVLRVFKRQEVLVLVVCVVGFLLGIPHITRVG